MLHRRTSQKGYYYSEGLLRCGKSCRLRWINYLKPDIKRGNFTEEEEEAIINLHELLGNRFVFLSTNIYYVLFLKTIGTMSKFKFGMIFIVHII